MQSPFYFDPSLQLLTVNPVHEAGFDIHPFAVGKFELGIQELEYPLQSLNE